MRSSPERQAVPTSTLELAPQRLALPSDAERIQELMRASVLGLFPRFFDERQTASAAVHITASRE